MASPELKATRISKGGKPAVQLTISNASGLGATLTSLGYVGGAYTGYTYSIVCTTPAEIDAARNPIAHLFGHAGKWLGN